MQAMEEPEERPRKALKRSGMPQRKTPMKQSSSLKRVPMKPARSALRSNKRLESKSQLAPRSEKRKKLYAEERVPLVREMLADNPWCELNRFILRIDKTYRGCVKHANGLHELKKRSAGGSLTDKRNLLRACPVCNVFLEDNPDLAWRAGLVIRFGEDYSDAEKRRRRSV